MLNYKSIKLILLWLVCFLLVITGWSVTTDTTEMMFKTRPISSLSDSVGKNINWDAQFSNGLLQVMEGNYVGAESTYQQILNAASDDSTKARALLCFGELYQHYANDLPKAQTIYQELISKYPGTKFAESGLFNLGLVNFHERKFEEAFSYFSTYSVKYPDGRYVDNARFMSNEAASRLGISPNRSNPTLIVHSGVIPQVEGFKVRIALKQGITSVAITSEGEYTLWDGDNNKKLKSINAWNSIRISQGRNGWYFGSSELECRKLIINPEKDSPISVDGEPYRGQIQLVRNGNGFTVVNVLSMDEYLYSVVAKEVSHDWPMESLKAQAVAARTYALSRMNVRSDCDYDLVCSQADQVYKGYASEKLRTTEAVEATRGEILVYDGEPIIAYFSANSGGIVEDSLSAFGLRKPYLKMFDDPYSRNAPGYRWSVRVSGRELQRRLNAKGLNIGTIQNIIVSEKSASGRVRRVKIFHANGITEIRGDDFRFKVESTTMRSTLFTIQKTGSSYLFNGYGYGHGVGMSQWGAYNMARQGKQYRDILQFYYPSAEMANL